MMRLLGSIVYILIQCVATPLFALLILLSALIDRHRLPKTMAKYWCHTMLLAGVVFRRVRYQISGLENLPNTPCIILSKHQSEWETLFLPVYLPPHSTVLKQELLKIPFFGWGLKLLNPIAINRSQKRASLEQVIKQGIERIHQGLYIVIFPEGTRVKPGYRGRYAQSGAQLAIKARVPVVPVAHNAGTFWPKGLLKNPGTIQVRFGPPLCSENKSSAELMHEVESWIESNMESITGHPSLSLPKTNQPLIIKKNKSHEIQINDTTIPYKIIRRKNRKTIGLIVDRDGLSVAIPHWVNITQVENTLREQQKWVIEKYNNWKDKPKPSQQEWVEGASIPWLGSQKKIKYQSNLQLSLFDDQDDYIIVDGSIEDIKSQVIQSYCNEIHKIIEQQVLYFSKCMQLTTVPKFYISNAQSRWGSCNHKGELRFNWRLMKASLEEIKYVVAHEMAHLVEFNHSPKFWDYVEKIYPNYKLAKMLIKKNDALYRQF